MTDTEEVQNQLHVTLHLLLQEATRTLQQFFRSLFLQQRNTEWTDTPEFARNFLSTLDPTILQKVHKPCQNQIREGNVKLWDITILRLLLTPMCKDKRLRKMVTTIADVRNTHAHLPHLTQVEFDRLFSKTENAIVGLGGDSSVCQQIKLTQDNLNTEDTLQNEKGRKLQENGKLVFEAGNFEPAIQFYNEALDIPDLSESDKSILHFNRSQAYFKVAGKSNSEMEIKKNYTMTKEDLQIVVKSKPKWWKGHYKLGQVLQAQKEFGSAILAYNQALEFNLGQQEILNLVNECHFEQRKIEIETQLRVLNRNDAEAGLPPVEDTVMSSGDIGDLQTVFSDANRLHNEQLLTSQNPKDEGKACVFFGKCCTHGMCGFEKDFKKAVEYFQRAVRVDNEPEGLYCLGKVYQNGLGVKECDDTAFQLFEEAAGQSAGVGPVKQRGVANSQFEIGQYFKNGKVKGQDYHEALLWYKRASDNECGQASYKLGHLYKDGLGGQRDLEKAVEYFQLAAKRDVVQASADLFFECLRHGDIEESQKWFDRYLESTNLKSKLDPSKLQPTLSEIQSIQTEFELPGSKVESPLKCPLSSTAETVSEVEKAFKHLLKPESNPSKNVWDYEDEIRSRATSGAIYSQMLLESMISFKSAHDLLLSPKSKTSKEEVSILQNLAFALKTAPDAVNMTVELAEKMRPLLKKCVINGFDIKSPVDMNARICACSIHGNFEDSYELLFQCLLKYPKEPYFHRQHCRLFADHGDVLRAFELAFESLQYLPNDIDLLLMKTEYGLASLRNVPKTLDSDSMVKDRLKFLGVAPSDHPWVPEAYYSLATITDSAAARLSHSIHYRGPPKVSLEYYSKGVEAEKKLLPCFLPFDSPTSKLVFEASMKAAKDGRPLAKLAIEKMMDEKIPDKTQGFLLPDKSCEPTRVKIVLGHRQQLKSLMAGTGTEIVKAESAAGNSKSMKNSREVRRSREKNEQKLLSFKPTTIRDMKGSKGQGQEGSIIRVMLMEDSVWDENGGLLKVIGCDSNGDYLSCSFYGVESSDLETRKAVSFGSVLSIVNPSFGGRDEGSKKDEKDCVEGLCVKDPSCLIFLKNGVDEPKCRFCGAINPPVTCSKCKRAKYCDAECQKKDWEILKHKFICKIKYTQFLDGF